MHGDWIAATATVLAAIIGIVGGYLLARYQRETKMLRFVVMNTEDLASTLREHGDFEIKFKDFSTTELVLSSITVRNTGNSSLRDIAFTLKIPGNHPFAQIKSGNDPEFPVSLPFFNAGESFRINALYTGKPSRCEIICRLPDTIVQIYSASEFYRMTDRRNIWKTILTAIGGALVATLAALGPQIIKTLF
jgi:hypothetical protein